MYTTLKVFWQMYSNLNDFMDVYSSRSTPGQNPLLSALARRKRTALELDDDAEIDDIEDEIDPNIENISTSSVADDQLEILKVSGYDHPTLKKLIIFEL